MDFRGDLVLRIYDENLDFDEISHNIKLEPTTIIKQGEKIRGKRNAPYDGWLYIKQIDNWENKFDQLNAMLDELLDYAEFIRMAKEKYKYVAFTFYIRTNSGQIGFQIPEITVKKLEELNIGLEFDILSFGMAE
ncbi:MAG: DUF4279 domain-containing protein [Eubacteriales bacterium]